MQVSPKSDAFLHSKLPIDTDEKILAVYRHHWFAYASSWAAGILVAVIIMGLAVAFTAFTSSNSQSPSTGHEQQIIAMAAFLSVLVLGATCVPVYLRSQEQ